MKIIQLLFTFSLVTIGISQTVTENCRFVGDIIFVLDESGSIGFANFQSIKSLTNQIIQQLDVDPQKRATRVGVVTYGRFGAPHVTVDVPFASYVDKADLQAQVSAINYSGNGTPLGPGLVKGWEEMKKGITGGSVGPRQGTGNPPESGIERVIFLFGDGMPNIGGTSSQVTDLATRIKTATFGGSLDPTTWGTPVSPSMLPFTVNIFTFFVGTGSTLTFFNGLASMPTSEWATSVTDFTMINPQQITARFCEIVVNGDIHYTTSDGLMYTFNGGGDYIYLRTEEKVEIHVRSTLVGQASAVAALAIEDKKTGSIVELWWDGIGSEVLHVNMRNPHETYNKLIDNITTQTKVKEPFYFQKVADGVMVIRIMNMAGFSVTVHYGGRAGFRVKVPKEWKTSGLIGNNNGNYNDDLCNREGRCLVVNATNDEEIHNIIGLDWAVLPSELLFEKWMATTDHELRYHPLVYSPEQLLKARQHCGDSQPCIYDYISTGSPEYATLTKQDNQHMKYFYAGDKL